ncbi:hypothetical protein LR48_Vigan06g033800 [Vigna angularis]|uniref:Cyclin-dependent kinase inhibitor 7 Inhibitor/interactor of CDK protein n=2 Tax=Phaseolus angularis TaxID=3914 RepID=A0A0L9UR33_PHAAN|nr:cyclin-dependent kinase inhibitor 7 [Vigna angularis]XP_017426682.1 cyclin-dependent kinase inhibitor 7 [Vigna angularis]KAG2375998.1 Cyclin-dependent kinase inhibitor 7 Inhibitor/interactor of CDK protein [Vigna angularis]KOM45032.1 hypothetical protein LR48_Vigan06g033800 [Vigna angularis]BAU00202.1 hypothetical protein VIGAN_10177500 [Vigna angularis var. angularis]
MLAQVGVRTRAPAALAMEPDTSARPTPKRKTITHTNQDPPKFSKSPKTTLRCLSPTSAEIPASCCSNNGSTSLDEDMIKLSDLEVESARVETSTFNGAAQIEGKEMNRSGKLLENSEETESVEMISCRASSKARTMPTESELEEFFVTAEKDIQKRFQDKYNYDVVKDMPLEGRYEWVQLKP